LEVLTLELKEILENLYFIREKLEVKPGVGLFGLEEIERLAFNYYWDYGCEYAVVTSFNEVALFPYSYQTLKTLSSQLPHKWNRICGALTGAFFVLALTLPEGFEKGVKELIRFHNETPLPIFKSTQFPAVPSAKAGSILCRDSILNWCASTGIHPRSRERSIRCAAITADIARKCGELLQERAPVS
jgi:hypothetical protein